MSYAFTIVHLPAAMPAFELALRAQVEARRATIREGEVEHCRLVRCESKVGQGLLPRGLAEARDATARAAKVMGDQYLEAETTAHAAERTYEEAKAKGAAPELLAAYATLMAQTELERATAQAKYQPFEDAALAAKKRVVDAIPDEELAHVGPIFDAQMEAAIDALVVMLPGVGKATEWVRVQIAGHCEQTEKDGAHYGVNIWPESQLRSNSEDHHVVGGVDSRKAPLLPPMAAIARTKP